MTKVCLYCGETFEVSSRHKTYCCAECRKLANVARSRKRGSTEKKKTERMDKRTKRIKENSKRLAEVNRKARESGMSYGQYKAMLFLQERGEAY